MIALLICTLLIFTTSLMLGKFAVQCLKIRGDHYTPIDTIFIGVFFTIILASLWHFFLPLSSWFLAFLIVLCLFIFFLKPKAKTSKTANYGKKDYFLLGMCFILIFSLLMMAVWQTPNYDSEFYHFQNILWFENYKLIPGLANLEDRFGFNSNYMLLSAIFSMDKNIFGELIFCINFSFTVFLLFSTFQSLRVSHFDKKIFLNLILLTIFVALNIRSLSFTTTDYLPQLLVFYLLSRILLQPKDFEKSKLFFFVVPLILVTIKLSTFFLLLISLYVLILLVKEKRYKDFSSLCILGGVFMLLWMVRNVIVSGYLVYPVYQIDLFSLDWKLPEQLAIMQQQFINLFPLSFSQTILTDPINHAKKSLTGFQMVFLYYSFWVCCLLGFLGMMIHYVKTKRINPLFVLFLVCSVANVIFVSVNGFDIRFITGFIFASFMCPVMLWGRGVNLRFLKILFCIIVIGIFIFSARLSFYNIRTVVYHKTLVEHPKYKRNWESIFLKPFPSYILQSMIGSEFWDVDFTKGKLDNKLDVYKTKQVSTGFRFPASIDYYESDGRFVNDSCVMMRGKEVEDGFKTDKDCFEKSTLKKYGEENIYLLKH